MKEPIRPMGRRFLDKIKRRMKGPGPQLVFDLGQIRRNMERLARLGDEYGVTFLLPVKAFPHPHVLKLAARTWGGFDVSNEAEFRKLPRRAAGWIFVTHPAPSMRWLERLHKRHKTVVIAESREQISHCVRLGVEFGLRIDSYQLLGLTRVSRFGVMPWAKDIKELLGMAVSRCRGFHVHHGSERNSARDYIHLARGLVRLAERVGISCRWLDLGGGLHSQRTEEFEPLFRQLRRTVPRAIDIFFEPGRLVSRGAGFAIGQILGVKKAGNHLLITTNLSKTVHLGWSTPQLILPKAAGARETTLVHVFGPTCFEGDKHGAFRIGADELEKNTAILFGNVTGYSLGLFSEFNGIPHPTIHFV
jgi:diaminopimelate decarboxylase